MNVLCSKVVAKRMCRQRHSFSREKSTQKWESKMLKSCSRLKIKGTYRISYRFGVLFQQRLLYFLWHWMMYVSLRFPQQQHQQREWQTTTKNSASRKKQKLKIYIKHSYFFLHSIKTKKLFNQTKPWAVFLFRFFKFF